MRQMVEKLPHDTIIESIACRQYENVPQKYTKGYVFYRLKSASYYNSLILLAKIVNKKFNHLSRYSMSLHYTRTQKNCFPTYFREIFLFQGTVV